MTEGYVHPDFASVVDLFGKQFDRPGAGGAALALTHHGETVVDVWAGSADSLDTRPWERDTLAMSFSTTKGVASSVLHLLVDRDQLAYDDPIAEHWPEFGANGKADITVRDLMTHRAGLHGVRSLVEDVEEVLDHQTMAKRVADEPRHPLSLRTSGYHAVTYGWLVAELVQRVSGRSLPDLLQSEIVEPLDLDGLYIGAPPAERHRIAQLFPEADDRQRKVLGRLIKLFERFDRTRPFVEALLLDDFDDLIFHPEIPLADTEMPAVNGFFTARSLAKLYGAIANGGEIDGHRLYRPETVDEFARVQVETRDYVLFIPMKWRTGYHRAFTWGRQPPRGFGHFGYGGSGAWADPQSRLSVALTLNRLGASTPVADVRLARLGGSALKASRRR